MIVVQVRCVNSESLPAQRNTTTCTISYETWYSIPYPIWLLLDDVSSVLLKYINNILWPTLHIVGYRLDRHVCCHCVQLHTDFDISDGQYDVTHTRWPFPTRPPPLLNTMLLADIRKHCHHNNKQHYRYNMIKSYSYIEGPCMDFLITSGAFHNWLTIPHLIWRHCNNCLQLRRLLRHDSNVCTSNHGDEEVEFQFHALIIVNNQAELIIWQHSLLHCDCCE